MYLCKVQIRHRVLESAHIRTHVRIQIVVSAQVPLFGQIKVSQITKTEIIKLLYLLLSHVVFDTLNTHNKYNVILSSEMSALEWTLEWHVVHTLLLDD